MDLEDDIDNINERGSRICSGLGRQLRQNIWQRWRRMFEDVWGYLRMSKNIQIFQLYSILSEDNKSYLIIAEEICQLNSKYRKDSKDGRDYDK